MTTLPSRQELRAKIPIPIRGLNTADDESQMNELYASDLQNVEIDDYFGYSKRSGYTRFNTSLMPITLTGSISSITSQSVSGATGVVWSGVVTAGMLFKMVSGTNIYTVSGLVSNANISLTTDYTDTITTGSYVISCPGVDGLYNYKYGTTQKLIAFGGGTMFNGGFATTGEFTNLWADMKNGEFVSATIFQDRLYYCNGYQFKFYDGTTVDQSVGTADPDNPVYTTTYTIGNANYLVALGSQTAADKSKFAFSDVNAPGTWPAANIYYAGDRDGGKIVGGAQCPTGLLIFKDNGIFMFGGIPGAGSLKKLSSIGCPCPQTIKEYQGQVYFVGSSMGQLGVYVYAGGNEVQCISKVVEPTMNSARKAYLSKICAGIYNNKYIVYYTSSTSTTNDVHIAFYLNRSFRDENGRLVYPAVKGNRGGSVLASVEIAGQEYLYSGSATQGFVYMEDNGTSDNGDAIDAYVTSKYFDFGRTDINKEVLRVYLQVMALGDWNIQWSIFKDFDTYGVQNFYVNLDKDASMWSEVVFLQTPWQTAKDQIISEFSVPYPTFGRFFKFRWRNAKLNEYFTVFPTSLVYKEESM